MVTSQIEYLWDQFHVRDLDAKNIQCEEKWEGFTNPVEKLRVTTE